jgi:hypothetical protein
VSSHGRSSAPAGNRPALASPTTRDASPRPRPAKGGLPDNPGKDGRPTLAARKRVFSFRHGVPPPIYWRPSAVRISSTSMVAMSSRRCALKLGNFADDFHALTDLATQVRAIDECNTAIRRRHHFEHSASKKTWRADLQAEGLRSNIGVIVFAIWSAFHPTPAPTPVQLKAREEYKNYLRDANSQRIAREAALCLSWRICREYSKARQDCAIAGNFETCVRVKMGDENLGSVSYCANDGSLLNPPADMPNRLECIVHDLGL